jgi:cell division protein YceG involved in septum cleavage
MKRKRTIIIVIVVVIAIMSFAATYAYANYFGPKTVLQANPDKDNCRQGNIFEGVDRQARFSVLSTCEKVIGIVHDMKGTKEDDGDYQFNLAVQEPYKKLLNEQNNKQVNGMLVIEIIPKDQASNPGIVQIPKSGNRIEAYGAWVTDNPHGWNELHPAWKVTVL